MKRLKRKPTGTLRVELYPEDQKRLDWIIEHTDPKETASSCVRGMIMERFARMQTAVKDQPMEEKGS